MQQAHANNVDYNAILAAAHIPREQSHGRMQSSGMSTAVCPTDLQERVLAVRMHLLGGKGSMMHYDRPPRCRDVIVAWVQVAAQGMA